MIIKLAYGLAVIAPLFCANVFASEITMASDFSVAEKPNGPVLTVSSENKGDEPAYGVQFEVFVADAKLVSKAVDTLGVDQKTSVEYSLADVFKSAGHYPVVIRTYYKDANGYQFTSLAVGFYDYKTFVIPSISIDGQELNLPVEGKGRLMFTLRNNGTKAREMNLNLFLPNEFSASNEASVLTLGPKQVKTLEFDIENFSGLQNSRYAVSLVGQYDDAGSHVGVAGWAVVNVVAAVPPVNWSIWLWAVLGVSTVMTFILVGLRMKQASRVK